MYDCISILGLTTPIHTRIHTPTSQVTGAPGFPTADQMIAAVGGAGFTATEKRLAGGDYSYSSYGYH